MSSFDDIVDRMVADAQIVEATIEDRKVLVVQKYGLLVEVDLETVSRPVVGSEHADLIKELADKADLRFTRIADAVADKFGDGKLCKFTVITDKKNGE